MEPLGFDGDEMHCEKDVAVLQVNVPGTQVRGRAVAVAEGEEVVVDCVLVMSVVGAVVLDVVVIKVVSVERTLVEVLVVEEV